MKRLLNLIFVFVVGLIVVMPFAVKANELTFSSEKKCEAPDAEGYCYMSVVIGMKDISGELNDVEVKITFNSSEVKYDSFIGQNAWENMGDTSIANKAINLKFTNINGNFTGSTTTFGTFVYKYPSTLSDLDCSAEISYLGKKVTTTETTTTTTTTVSNPSTGVSLPLAILAGGLVIAGVVYYVSKRNTKMYKI